jgi:hypothetical protein
LVVAVAVAVPVNSTLVPLPAFMLVRILDITLVSVRRRPVLGSVFGFPKDVRVVVEVPLGKMVVAGTLMVLVLAGLAEVCVDAVAVVVEGFWERTVVERSKAKARAKRWLGILAVVVG